MWTSYFFFFSSRRRHTRFDCDWSSDVCSSDLLCRDEAQRLREIRLLEDLALLKRHAAGAEDSRGFGVEARARRSRVAGEHEVHQEAVLGELDRGLDHLRKALPPVALQRRGHDLQD